MKNQGQKPADLVVDLRQVSQGDLSRAGGKGANLGELMRAGLPVPPGFVVTTAAYDSFVAHNHLSDTIAATLREGQGNGTAIREAFERASIPPEVEQTILEAYRQLGQDAVAVRSSATAEDLPGMAFAGQQDTFLNVVGVEALLNAVRRCWASLWTDRAISYRDRQHVDQLTVKLAVVVQRMVAAEVAGVMFTANPVTGARDEIVVDANPGLGEAVVSGQVTPDHFVLDQRAGRVKERQPGRREVIIRARSGGGTEQVAGQAEIPSLPDDGLRQLARLGVKIQSHFGTPQDIEWAWTGGEFFIVQARPITALPEPAPRASKLEGMLAGVFAEMFMIRPYPLDVTVWLPGITGAITPLFALLGFASPFDEMLIEEDGIVSRLRVESGPRPKVRVLLAPIRIFQMIRRYNPLDWQADPLVAETQARARDLEARDLKVLSWEELLTTLREAMGIPRLIAGEIRCRYFPGAALAMGLLRLELGLLGRADRFGVLLSGVENKTLEANQALESLAARIRSNSGLAETFTDHEARELWAALETQPAGKDFLVKLRAFLDRYGHREATLSTAFLPAWKDAPEVVLGILKGLAQSEGRPAIEHPAWEVARDELLAHPRLRFRPLRSAFLKFLARARCLLQIRESTHFYATLPLPVIRRTALELGRRLVSVGVLDTPEDVFHLKLDELERLTGTWPPSSQLVEALRARALQREEKRAALEGTPLVDPRLYRQLKPAGDALLRGTPGSPGVAEGPVRIVHNGAEFGKLSPGDVLVAPFTNPAWTPLFHRAVAVVVDTGGAASHAAIVAREYGIPAVMATTDGTQRLVDGQRVRVDGDQGLVFDVVGMTKSESQ